MVRWYIPMGLAFNSSKNLTISSLDIVPRQHLSVEPERDIIASYVIMKYVLADDSRQETFKQSLDSDTTVT